MAKPYDSSLKWLIDVDPNSWVRLLGLPHPEAAEMIDADLSTVTAEADRIIRVSSPQNPYLLHIELQASYDADMAERMLRYHVLLRYRHRLPVRSVLLLLRSEADGTRMSGSLRYDETVGSRLAFEYTVVRLWQIPAEAVLSAGGSALPLVPLSLVQEGLLQATVHAVESRLKQESFPVSNEDILAATHVLMGLRFTPEFIDQLMEGVQKMEESSTYQRILARGEARGEIIGQTRGEVIGKAEGERRMLVLFASRRLGQPSDAIVAQLNSLQSTQVIESLAGKIEAVESWDELLAGL